MKTVRTRYGALMLMVTAPLAMAEGAIADFNIPAQPLRSALNELGTQGNVQVLFRTDDVPGSARAPAVVGRLAISEAVSGLLNGSNLKYDFVNDRTLRVMLASTTPVGAPTTEQSTDRAKAQGAAGDIALEEIIVTAQKRAERLKDVPVPVTAVTSDLLLDRNQTKAEDFFSSVPGINLQTTRNRSFLAIRGITTGPVTGNPIVGYTIDDIPYGSSTGQGGLFGGAPDIDPSELTRIEVLRGPQGTLYGASSMGGLVKYVTVDPSTDSVSGTIAAGVSSVSGAGDMGYNLRGAINVPVAETFAFRASGFTREEPGYIDNVVTGKQDVNKTRVSGGRLSTLWRPSEAFSAKLSALYQDRKAFGSANADASLGSRYLQSDQFGAGDGYTKNQLYSAVLNGELGAVAITSITAYSTSKAFDLADFSATGLTSLWPTFYPDADVSQFATTLTIPFEVGKFSQEVRLAAPIGESVDLILGGFYTREATKFDILVNAADADTGGVVAIPLVSQNDFTFKESAVFANVNFKFSEHFDVQTGARYSQNRQRLDNRESGLFTPGGFAETVTNSRGHSLTYQVTPRLRLSPDHMIYARLATGYRPGGPNVTCSSGNLCQYQADETVNYEVGAKGDLFDNTLSYDISLFNIDWKDIQVTQKTVEGFTYNANAKTARSRGLEFSFETRPAKGLTLALWGAYTDAQLNEAFAPNVSVYAAKGDRLPFSSRWSGRASANYETAVGQDMTGSIGASAVYVGMRRGEFVASAGEAALRQTYPSYVQVDLNAGLKYEDWKLNLFVQNATNRDALIGGGYNNQFNFNPNWFNHLQPRTIGMNLERKF